MEFILIIVGLVIGYVLIVLSGVTTDTLFFIPLLLLTPILFLITYVSIQLKKIRKVINKD